MMAQLLLSVLLFGVLVYAWTEYRRTPVVASLSSFVAASGFYFIWFPDASTRLAELVGIGRGVDLILYTWVCISLLVILNLHLKLRTQLELFTALARVVAIGNAQCPSATEGQRPSSPMRPNDCTQTTILPT